MDLTTDGARQLMAQTILVRYENGALRPTTPLALRENQMVEIQILSEMELDRIDGIVQSMIDDGFLTAPPHPPDGGMPSDGEHDGPVRLSSDLPGATASDLIIRERGEVSY